MSKIEFLVNFHRNANSLGLPLKECFLLMAIAKLSEGQEDKECTSTEVNHLTGEKSCSATLRTMHYWLHIREGLNAQNKHTYFFRLNAKGTEKVTRLLTFYKKPAESIT